MTTNFKHTPIMTNEVLEAFSTLPENSTIVDGTLGKGGHTKTLLDKGFNVIGIDRDKEAIKEASNNLKDNKNIKIIHDNFSNINKLINKTDGILLDLGISTHQLEEKDRGFGFEGKLDMRMDQEQDLTAKKVANEYTQEQLENILKSNGEKSYPEEISKQIVKQRQKQEINKGQDLLNIIDQTLPKKYKRTRKHHWATPTFRALRIEVNKDFENLKNFLETFHQVLNKDGKLCIITFHTKEESIVRKHLRHLKEQDIIRLETKKGLEASKEEINTNPKAKRAKLWVAKKK